ncbi:Chaperone protein DnaJ [archaeon HR06]|nr:Chaperone protein DnaJ [archaeon HR06]
MKEDFETLGLSPNASVEEVRKAFKRLALKYHPDKCKEEGALEKFRKIVEAYNNIMKEKYYTVIKKEVKGKFRIEVDWDSCVGSASCTIIAPKTFRIDESKWKVFSTKAPLEVNQEGGDSLESILLAAQSCPFKAIFIYNEKGERIYP